jgi:predicted benzoate:H+ symporter BenE
VWADLKRVLVVVRIPLVLRWTAGGAAAVAAAPGDLADVAAIGAVLVLNVIGTRALPWGFTVSLGSHA